MMKELYLVTGATGNLGHNVVKQLLEAGKSVRVLARQASKLKFQKEVQVVVGSLSDLESLKHFFEREEGTEVYVIHCASQVALSPEPDESVYESNVIGTENIVKMCVERTVKKLVYVSSTGAIPEPVHKVVITEPLSIRPEQVRGYYSQTKAVATNTVLSAVKQFGLDASIVYPSGIFGPYDYGLGLITSTIIEMMHGKIPCGIEGSFNAVDVRDLAAGIITCARIGIKGEGYIMAGETQNMGVLFNAIASASGCKPIRLVIPWILVFPVAVVLEWFGKVTKRQMRLTTFTLYNLKRNNHFSSQKAKTELGFKCRPFEESIRDEVLWLKSEGC